MPDATALRNHRARIARKNKKKFNKRGRRPETGLRIAGGRKFAGRVIPAPVAARQVIQNPMFLRIGRVRNKDSLLWHVRFRAAQLVFSAANVLAINVQTSVDSGGQYYIWPTNAKYVPPSVYQLCRLFGQYCVTRLKMNVVARVTTAANSTIFCSYFRDPEYFQSLGIASGTTLLTEGNLTDSMGCKSWPTWKSMTCPPKKCDPKSNMCYTTGADVANVYDYTVTAGTERTVVQGVYGITCTGNPTPGAQITAADVYFEMDILLTGFRTAGVTNFSETDPFHKEYSIGTRLSQVESKLSSLSLVTDSKAEGDKAFIREAKTAAYVDSKDDFSELLELRKLERLREKKSSSRKSENSDFTSVCSTEKTR